jgi:hypothetical protein
MKPTFDMSGPTVFIWGPPLYSFGGSLSASGSGHPLLRHAVYGWANCTYVQQRNFEHKTCSNSLGSVVHTHAQRAARTL